MTIIVDLDGCILLHGGRLASNQWSTYELLPHVQTAFNTWERDGHCVVIMTGRKECCREELERALRRLGLWWDHLVMGVSRGQRLLINDAKPDGTCSASCTVLKRNEGLGALL